MNITLFLLKEQELKDENESVWLFAPQREPQFSKEFSVTCSVSQISSELMPRCWSAFLPLPETMGRVWNLASK